MADVKISELTALTSPDGAEELVVNDSGTTKKITITNATSASLPKAGGTMTGVIAGFESTGIDDNATSTAVTIDASENVLVGKTAQDMATVGAQFRGDAVGLVQVTRDGGEALHLNRLTNDGNVLSVYKDTALKGSIAVTASGIGIQLGGTGAANTLDDYEEGTWTIALTPLGGSIALSDAAGTYTKVGRQVTVCARANVSSVSSPSSLLTITGLPFTPINSASAYSSFSLQGSGWNFSGVQMISGAVTGTTVYVFGWNNGNQTAIASYMQAGAGMTVSFTYFTDS